MALSSCVGSVRLYPEGRLGGIVSAMAILGQEPGSCPPRFRLSPFAEIVPSPQRARFKGSLHSSAGGLTDVPIDCRLRMSGHRQAGLFRAGSSELPFRCQSTRRVGERRTRSGVRADLPPKLVHSNVSLTGLIVDSVSRASPSYKAGLRGWTGSVKSAAAGRGEAHSGRVPASRAFGISRAMAGFMPPPSTRFVARIRRA